MGFFGSISPPILDETSTPIIRRAFHRARIVGNFALVQAGVQIIGFLGGILLVRWLPQREYGYFTIANTMQGTLNLLADIQIRSGVDYETVKQTLQRIIDLDPNFAPAETARKRIALLKLELKAKQQNTSVKLGTYEQNIGLKQTRANPMPPA